MTVECKPIDRQATGPIASFAPHLHITHRQPILLQMPEGCQHSVIAVVLPNWQVDHLADPMLAQLVSWADTTSEKC